MNKEQQAFRTQKEINICPMKMDFMRAVYWSEKCVFWQNEVLTSFNKEDIIKENSISHSLARHAIQSMWLIDISISLFFRNLVPSPSILICSPWEFNFSGLNMNCTWYCLDFLSRKFSILRAWRWKMVNANKIQTPIIHKIFQLHSIHIAIY